ncbi:phosphodiester glycosidase family protein [Marinisporobacter balticus]|uniref:Uncharacterized protein DUF2233 n=1 Tax=Marinisporobacter balticus TaxID=2018667 RepID=A0A4R2KHR5_9FIRM|nr:phosphodiester glycosidase family protein [Marinisporobacter balticus]TCO73153.1 uncharacterized protein DUF2233 [Marinisporobacter balticus]
MQKWKKTLISFGLGCSLIFGNIQTFVYADWNNSVYQEKNEEYIAKGVKHEQILKFTDSGWVNLNIIRMNLNEEDNGLDLLFHQNGLNQKARLSELVNQSENVVGAVNGDFFNMKGAATLGPMVKDGELLTTTANTGDAVPTFNLTKDNIPFIENWTNSKMTLANKNTLFDFEVFAVNKETAYEHAAILYTPKWGERTPPISKNLSSGIEMVIENDVVTEIVSAGEGKYIPADGYVIFAAGTKAAEIGSNFVVGDSVRFSAITNPNFENLSMSVGSGSFIVKEGFVESNYHINISGKHPRTALGISKDKTQVFLVTIDGRTASYTGVTQEELGRIMIELGAYDAINLDGGGSTDMVVRSLGEESKKVVNNLSEGSERRIMNGIGVISKASKSNNIGGIKLEVKENNMLINTSKELIIKAYDENYNPVKIDLSKVKWHISGVDGEFYNNTFKATTKGVGVIAVEYEGKYDNAPIRVIENASRLEVYPSKINIGKNKQKYITVKVTDQDGYGATVDLNSLNIDIPTNLGVIDNEGLFHSSDQSGSGVIKISYGNLMKYIPVVIGSKEMVIDDFENSNGTFISYPAEVTGSYTLSNFSKVGKSSGEISYDFTTTDATRGAYLLFDNGGIRFNQKPEKLGTWIYGNMSGHMVKAKLVGENGNIQNITIAPSVDWEGWKFVEMSVPASVKGSFQLERIYIVETNSLSKDIGKIYFDQLTAFYPNRFEGSIPMTQNTIVESRNKKSELKGEASFRLFVHGDVSEVDTIQDDVAVDKIANIANDKAEMNIFTQFIDETLKGQLNNKTLVVSGGYVSNRYKNSMFINLDNSSGSLRETNFEQWRWFLNMIQGVDSKNIFITLPKALVFKDTLEEKLFKDTLKKLKKEKNIDIWVLTGGHNDFNVYSEDGIRYVALKSYPRVNDQDIANELKYMMFTVNDDGVTYEILPLNAEE